MYPKYDFRHLLDNAENEKISHSLGQEPIQEICRSWEYLGKDTRRYKIFCDGIKSAVNRNRYHLDLLGYFIPYGEFYDSVLEGLFEKWISIDIHRGEEIIVGSQCISEIHNCHDLVPVNVSVENRIKLLNKPPIIGQYRVKYLQDAEDIIKWIGNFS